MATAIPPDQLLVIMTVDIGGGRMSEIKIHAADDPTELAASFVEAHGLDPSAVIGEGPDGPVTLLPMLIDHIQHNKHAAYERVVAAFAAGEDSEGSGLDLDLVFDDESEVDLPLPEFHLPSGPVATETPAKPPVATRSRPPEPPKAADGDDSSGHGVSVSSSRASSSRRLMSTEEEREVMYNTLRQQFAGTGKSVARRTGPRSPG